MCFIKNLQIILFFNVLFIISHIYHFFNTFIQKFHSFLIKNYFNRNYGGGCLIFVLTPYTPPITPEMHTNSIFFTKADAENVPVRHMTSIMIIIPNISPENSPPLIPFLRLNLPYLKPVIKPPADSIIYSISFIMLSDISVILTHSARSEKSTAVVIMPVSSEVMIL